jgi:hypothetical protein
MRRISPRPGWLIGGGLGLVAVVLIADAAGWLGPLLVCGADGAAVCVDWPVAATWGTWLLFVGCIAGLVTWQVRDWRRDPTPLGPSDDADPAVDSPPGLP